MFILKEAVLDRSRRKEDTYCCFLDIKKAYDTVFREGLWRWEAGVKGKMWRVLKNIYAKVESSVVVNGGKESVCILSPTLFAIFIDGLAREVKACNLGAEVVPQVGAKTLLFADDIVLNKQCLKR